MYARMRGRVVCPRCPGGWPARRAISGQIGSLSSAAVGGWVDALASSRGVPRASPWVTVEEDLHTTLAAPAGRCDDLAAVTLSGAFA